MHTLSPENEVTYSSFLINISSHLQQVFHTLQMTFPRRPNQWRGTILKKTFITFLSYCFLYPLQSSIHPILYCFSFYKDIIWSRELTQAFEKSF